MSTKKITDNKQTNMPGGRGKITGKDGKPFTKGDPRINREGRPPKLPGLDVLLADVLGQEINGQIAIKAILSAILKKALTGDIRAGESLIDRYYPKLQFELLTEDQLDQIINALKKRYEND